MGKKMRDKDGHKGENNEVEEGNAIKKQGDVLNVSIGNVNDDSRSSDKDIGKNKKEEDKNEKKKDRIKKRKQKFDTDAMESPKAHKKHKKSKDVGGEVKEISMGSCLDGKEKMEQERSEVMGLENNFDGEAKRVRKDKDKKKNRDGVDALAIVTETLEHGKMQEPVDVQEISSTGDINKMVHGKENEYEKRKKKKKEVEKVSGNGHIAVRNIATDGNDTDKENSAGNEVECRKLRDYNGNSEDGNRGRKKKSKSVKSDSESKHHEDDARTRKNVDTTNQSENLTPKDRSKRVSFCDDVEVFPCVDAVDNAKKDGKEGLVQGKRYSKEEDEIIMNALADYIESHNLGDEGTNMILNCGSYPKVRNCWKEIQAAIPWRPIDSVYHRAHILLERDEKREWTPEECEIIRNFVQEHGPKWKLLADTLGKHRHHVKDKWRRIKLDNTNRGHWSQEEYQNLFDLVNKDLCMRALEEKKSKHGMLRDNIPWTAISDNMQTRTFFTCCIKWYNSLTSPMVAEGSWADTDDYRMLDALSSLDACCMEDVDWDNLIEHRSGDLCRKRWSQMIRHLGPDVNKPFVEQVEILANRYRPDMLDAREAYDKKTPVDLP
ncbi:hypothetical protein PTKIN_Ptkin03bG0016200 [Pterospermum kingtungense]